MRQLDNNEIEQLEGRQHCRAEDWTLVRVDDDFEVGNVRNVNFHGHVEIGRGVRITDVKMLKGSGIQARPFVVSVLNEGGEGNVMLLPELTAQLAWMMIHCEGIREFVNRGIGETVRKTVIGDYAVVEGATKIVDCTINSNEAAPTYIGVDVIMEKSVTACGATVTDGAKVYESFVGEAVHIGKGFSSEASLFFANAYMDNGEACAALCGPFACSHHKSTLLIGGEFSFYNAGSNTNQSNHAYKMGPIHWGTLQRGAKTASGCHILWPATIGAFSMVMGKLTQHPDLSNLPFSYVLASQEKTYVVPGVNIRTVGTWRDINKWPKRDMRKENARRDILSLDFPNPYIRQLARRGLALLNGLKATAGDVDEYTYEGCCIRRSALEKGIDYYTLIIDLCDKDWDGEEYVDMLGCIARKRDVDEIVRRAESGEIGSMESLLSAISALEHDFPVVSHNEEAYDRWVELVKADARKEYDMGDVSEEQLNDFVKGVKWRREDGNQ